MKLLLKKIYYKIPYLYELKNFVVKLVRGNPDLKDMQDVAPHVYNLIGKLGLDIFPMYGTLLALHREGKVTTADDFDFATLDPSVFCNETIEKLEQAGAKLCAFSVVNDSKELVELSFVYQEAKVDIFLLTETGSEVEHKCPNFRKSKPQLEVENGLTYNVFPSFFSVKYPKITLIKCDKTGLVTPLDPESIFEHHYAADWMIPKEKNFIDFSNYQFINAKSFSVYGEPASLKAALQSYFSAG